LNTYARLAFLLVSLLGCALGSRATLVEESGSLREFVAGNEPGSAYDNWLSHVSERVARPGYNVYAPPLLDPQLDGFGQFSLLDSGPAGDSLLTAFHGLFGHLLLNQPLLADSLLAGMGLPAFELVRFQDSDSGHELLMLRERLDSTWVDPGLSPSPADDVVGGFALGWGLYVCDPQAARPEIALQVPHPCDDYITPAIGLEAFLELGAGMLMINGAGREVLFSGSTYSNSVSLSDPSRNGRHPFQMAHEAFVDHWQAQSVNELVLQVHSYDDLSHRNLKSCVVSGGPYTRLALPPLYDAGHNGLGALNRLAHPVLGADALGFPHAPLPLTSYVSHGALQALTVHGGLPDTSFSLVVSPSLLGYINNSQFEYTFGHHGLGYEECDTPERLLHIELDELPLPAHELGESAFHLADSLQLATWHNFQPAWTVYRPLFVAIGEAFDAWTAAPVTPAPTAPTAFAVLSTGEDRVRVKWRPSECSELYTYEILLDSTGAIGPTAMVVDRATIDNLCWAPLTSTWITGLEYHVTYTMAIRAVDRLGRVSALSNTASAYTNELVPPLVDLQPGALAHFWTRNDTVQVTLRVRDQAHLVDLSSLQARLDHELDGDYDGPGEDWFSLGLNGFVADTSLQLPLVFAQGGPRMLLELRAHDDQSSLWGYSGSSRAEGAADDFWAIQDTTAPPPFPGDLTLATGGTLAELVLAWSPQPVDSTWAGYRIALSDSFFLDPAAAAIRLDAASDSLLGLPQTDSLVISALPWGPGPIWVLAWQEDHAGNRSGPAGPLLFQYPGSRYCEVTDLRASLQAGSIRLEWDSLCHQPDLQITGWRVHWLSSPWEAVSLENLWLETAEPFALVPLGLNSSGIFRVVALHSP
ncbi:MAG: fibronectin type III domain-containing protein, partial [Candidatus Cloacimonetes bacterium]|nr:fibronectin type III domain-containing protein [Candidatus Cloacimonadota bacterium]